MNASDYLLFSGVLSRSTDSSRFVVPVYQRNYDWQYEHCEKLLEDIVFSGKTRECHFLGSLVTVKLEDAVANVDDQVIIDGQQRITTIFLILRILMDMEGLNADAKSKIKGTLNLYKSDVIKIDDEETRLRLKLIKTDAEQLDKVFNLNMQFADKNSNIVKNYNFLKRLMQDEQRNDPNSANTIFRGIEQLSCVWIQLDKDKDKPQEIFESINSTGMELSVSDLIRNYLLMTEVSQEELYEDYWLKIETTIMEVDPRNTSKNLSEFFRHYLSMKRNAYVENKNTYKSFVQYMNKRKENGKTNEEILKELLEFSKIYSYLLLGKYPYDEEINYYLYKLNEIKQTTIYPFLLRLFYNMEKGIQDTYDVKRTLKFLVQYFIRRLIVGYGTNGYNKIFPEMHSKCCDENGVYSYGNLKRFFANNKSKEVIRIPLDNEVENTLKVADLYEKNNLCKPILEIIENSTEYDMYAKGSADVDFSNYNIEHIMPQSIGSWKQDLENIPDWQDKFDSLCGNIGNLTLTKLNSEMSNKRFYEKKYEMKQAKDQCDFLDKEIYESDVWNFEIIANRQKRLVQRLLNVLHIELPEVDRKEYYTLDDNLANQTLARFTINDKSFDVKYAKDFYLGILRYCFDFYPEDATKVVDSGECRQFITRDENAWKEDSSAKPVHVRNGIYANTHGSKDDFCKRLKKFLNCINDDLASTVRIYKY